MPMQANYGAPLACRSFVLKISHGVAEVKGGFELYARGLCSSEHTDSSTLTAKLRGSGTYL